MASQLGLGMALQAIGGMYDDAEKRRELARQRQYQATMLALQQQQETRMARGQAADDERLRAAQAFEQNYKLFGQTPGGTELTDQQVSDTPGPFQRFIEKQRTLPSKALPTEGTPDFSGYIDPATQPTGRNLTIPFEDSKTAAMNARAAQAQAAAYQRLLTGQQGADSRAELAAGTAKEVAGIRATSAENVAATRGARGPVVPTDMQVEKAYSAMEKTIRAQVQQDLKNANRLPQAKLIDQFAQRQAKIVPVTPQEIEQEVQNRIEQQVTASGVPGLAAYHARRSIKPVSSHSTTQSPPQPGAFKDFPNGKRGQWDGQGWVEVK